MIKYIIVSCCAKQVVVGQKMASFKEDEKMSDEELKNYLDGFTKEHNVQIIYFI